MPGTAIAYHGVVLRTCYATPDTFVRHNVPAPSIVLRAPYAVSGTDTHSLCHVQYWRACTARSRDIMMRYPVLASLTSRERKRRDSRRMCTGVTHIGYAHVTRMRDTGITHM
eukprot:32714-Rhodomonas_salina.2